MDSYAFDTLVRARFADERFAEAGFERGEKALPTDADVGTIISAADVQSVWGIIPDDGQDDTEALQTLVSAHSSGGPGAYILIQLPAGQYCLILLVCSILTEHNGSVGVINLVCLTTHVAMCYS